MDYMFLHGVYVFNNTNCFAIGAVLVATKVTWVNLELSVEKLVPRGYMVYSVRYHVSYAVSIFQVFLIFSKMMIWWKFSSLYQGDHNKLNLKPEECMLNT